MMTLEELVAVVSKTVQLKRIGRERWEARCPFAGHLDKTPSFHVWYSHQTSKPRYYCHGCGAKGDSADWMRIFHGTRERFDRNLIEERKQERIIKQRRELILTAYHDWRPDCCCPEWLLEIK
jgi:hypothetical protein